MKDKRQVVGRNGEDEACQYLLSQGHTIIERNYRSSHLELDIISLDREGLHIVEVKSRVAPVQADPAVNVNHSKMQRMVQAAGAFLSKGNHSHLRDLDVFFDVITVVFYGNERFEIEYYPKAFIPLYV